MAVTEMQKPNIYRREDAFLKIQKNNLIPFNVESIDLRQDRRQRSLRFSTAPIFSFQHE
jgi:hypothetical protein